MKLAALGDLFLGDQLACVGFGVRSYCDQNGYDHLFDGVRSTLQGHDLVVANLETVLSQAGDGDRNSLNLVLNRGNPRAAAAIKAAGINLLTLANNHIFDYGPRGIDDTIAALDEAGLAHCGTKRKSIHVHEQSGRSYAFLSWSLVPDSADAREFYNVSDTLDPILAELRETRPHADKIVLSLHAGNEFIGQPSHAFQRQCHELIDAGADVILGHHPHVLQPIDRYQHGLIAYSLGNFVFCSWSVACRTGMVLGASVDDAQWLGCSFFEIDRRTYAPILISDNARIKALSQHVSSPTPLSSEDYLRRVRELRLEYRRSTAMHVLKNLYRTKWRSDLVRLAMTRAKFLWSIRKVEGNQPDLVYTGPSYVRPKEPRRFS
jgi:poly-gamma-glutamate synthesis protein (capsule biosynthesis protein)